MKIIDLLVKKTNEEGWRWPNPEAEARWIKAINKVAFIDCEGYLPMDIRMDSSYEIDSEPLKTIVTKSQYESALAASEGWIEWGGGECPVQTGLLVDVRYSDGTEEFALEANIPSKTRFRTAAAPWWRKDGHSGDIIAYRLHKPGIKSRYNDGRQEQDLNECIGQGVQWQGDGVPPVGTVCMAKLANGWTDVKVAYIGDEGGCREALVLEIKSTKPAWADEFRPLRTEAEKAREKLAASLHVAAGASPIELNGIGPLYFELADAIISGSVFGTTFKADK